MAEYIDTYYRRSLVDDIRHAPLARDIEVDVCVIGGGLAGLTAALECARGGRKVALLERNRIAWGASGRNGGFVTAGYATGIENIERRVSRADAETLYRMSIEGVEIVRSNIEGLRIAGADVAPGILRVLRHDGADGLKAYRDEMNTRFGEHLEFRDRAAVQADLSSPSYHQGLYDPDGFHFHPLNYARAIGAEIVRLGGAIHEETPALALAPQGAGHVVTTPMAKVTAQHVVLAGGGYTDGIEKRLTRSFLPIATYVLLTERLGDLLPQTIRTKAAIGDDRRAGDYYRVVDGDRILWGGRITTRTADPQGLAGLLRREMVGTYPQLKDVKVELAWSGLMSYARHLMPQIGKLGEGLWHCTAFGGHGMNTTAIGGKVIAEAITGASDRYRLFAPFGLDWNGGPFGRVAVQLTYWSLQAQDAWRERGNRR
ncbi:NAD(P)/FAD-dependent oxidoreductase [Dongia rigui]|uniref:FAD-binding oxidoreductase n=1 Tax=Dongia rigui TaxID=940149 RepID=A0ABU5E2D0_9PROT|nr:FAD-binding oxidoreductase [Dongia rigui]MDY0873711.1 FAD-binding oxidoreductase [Dongia rigui]